MRKDIVGASRKYHRKVRKYVKDKRFLEMPKLKKQRF